MTTSTSTPTEVTSIAASPVTGGGVAIAASGGALRTMTLRRGPGYARIALVPDRALLLAGDRVRIEVDVAAGLRLEIVDTAGTVAYDMHSGEARWDVTAAVADGGTLTWAGLPFVVSAGASVHRTLAVDLAPGAGLALRETLVLGRHREQPGSIMNSTRVSRGDRPVLVEELDGQHLAPYRILDSVLTCGPVPRAAGAHDVLRLDLESGDTLWRAIASDAHEPAAALDAIWAEITAADAPTAASGPTR